MLVENYSHKIVFVHLLNNYTGSPKVLRQVIIDLQERGYEIELITNKTDGFLSGIEGIKYTQINYDWVKNKYFRTLKYLFAQIHFFFLLLFKKNSFNTVLYINTLLPFGAAIAGKLRGMRVIYHVHEFYVQKSLISKLYAFVLYKFSDKIIYVSNSVKVAFKDLKNSIVAYNSLSADELASNEQKSKLTNPDAKKIVLMISSFKEYKGVYKFIELSRELPNRDFELVLSCTKQEIDLLCSKTIIPKNLTIHSLQKDLLPFYLRAKIVLNLSIPDQCVESFGLTILEAMSFGIPTIVPPVGGPTELVDNGINGYHFDSRNLAQICEKIDQLFQDKDLYQQLSLNSYSKANAFRAEDMINNIEKEIQFL